MGDWKKESLLITCLHLGGLLVWTHYLLSSNSNSKIIYWPNMVYTVTNLSLFVATPSAMSLCHVLSPGNSMCHVSFFGLTDLQRKEMMIKISFKFNKNMYRVLHGCYGMSSSSLFFSLALKWAWPDIFQPFSGKGKIATGSILTLDPHLCFLCYQPIPDNQVSC